MSFLRYFSIGDESTERFKSSNAKLFGNSMNEKPVTESKPDSYSSDQQPPAKKAAASDGFEPLPEMPPARHHQPPPSAAYNSFQGGRGGHFSGPSGPPSGRGGGQPPQRGSYQSKSAYPLEAVLANVEIIATRRRQIRFGRTMAITSPTTTTTPQIGATTLSHSHTSCTLPPLPTQLSVAYNQADLPPSPMPSFTAQYDEYNEQF